MFDFLKSKPKKEIYKLFVHLDKFGMSYLVDNKEYIEEIKKELITILNNIPEEDKNLKRYRTTVCGYDIIFYFSNEENKLKFEKIYNKYISKLKHKCFIKEYIKHVIKPESDEELEKVKEIYKNEILYNDIVLKMMKENEVPKDEIEEFEDNIKRIEEIMNQELLESVREQRNNELFEITKDVLLDIDQINKIKEAHKSTTTHNQWKDFENPKEVQLSFWALHYSMIKDYEKTIKYSSEGLKLNPKNVYFYYLRGRTYSDIDKFEEGMTDLNEALKLNPEFSDVYIERGLIKELIGDMNGAKKRLYQSKRDRTNNRFTRKFKSKNLI